MTTIDDERKTLVACIEGVDAVRKVLHEYLRKATEPKSAANPEGAREDVADKLAVAIASCTALRGQVREAFASFGVRPQ